VIPITQLPDWALMHVADNIAGIRDRIEKAARRAGRQPDEITLMAVSKTFPAESVCEAYAAGIRVFGENRVQEFAAKSGDVGGLPGIEFHLIGHLQSNKVARAAELFQAVDSLDSLRVASRLDEAVARFPKPVPVLIEINSGGEEQKSGVLAGSPALEELLTAAPALRHLQFRGLMTVPPYLEDPEAFRPFFRQLRQLRDTISARQLPGIALDILSMGMSHDFEVAIEEGSTCVRIGTAIFGSREPA
jgi:hypothetical protein